MADTEHTINVQSWNRQVIEEFRANGGKVGGQFEGAPIVLVTTTGARSGTRRTSPLVYLQDDDRILVFASNRGAPNNPAWYHNVLVNPDVTVEIGTQSSAATAVVMRGAERDQLYARQGQRIPAYAEYQAQTSRVIPVVALYPKGAAPDPSRARALGDELVEIHAGLREQLTATRAAVDAYLDGRDAPSAAGMPTPSLRAELRAHCLSYCANVHAHHTREDSVFPALERQAPEVRPALVRLREEHRMVARLVQELQAVLDDAGSGDAATVRADLERLSSLLEAHFDDEEAQLIPVLNALGTVPAAQPG